MFSSGSSNPTCYMCEKVVYQKELLTVDQLVYHKICFRCNQCQKRLTVGGFAMFNNKPYCKPHFNQLFKSRGGRYGSQDGGHLGSKAKKAEANKLKPQPPRTQKPEGANPGGPKPPGYPRSDISKISGPRPPPPHRTKAPLRRVQTEPLDTNALLMLKSQLKKTNRRSKTVEGVEAIIEDEPMQIGADNAPHTSNPPTQGTDPTPGSNPRARPTGSPQPQGRDPNAPPKTRPRPKSMPKRGQKPVVFRGRRPVKPLNRARTQPARQPGKTRPRPESHLPVDTVPEDATPVAAKTKPGPRPRPKPVGRSESGGESTQELEPQPKEEPETAKESVPEQPEVKKEIHAESSGDSRQRPPEKRKSAVRVMSPSRTSRCALCLAKTYGGFEVGDKVFHDHCFQCLKCSKKLSEDNYHINDLGPFCLEHGKRKKPSPKNSAQSSKNSAQSSNSIQSSKTSAQPSKTSAQPSKTSAQPSKNSTQSSITASTNKSNTSSTAVTPPSPRMPVHHRGMKDPPNAAQLEISSPPLSAASSATSSPTSSRRPTEVEQKPTKTTFAKVEARKGEPKDAVFMKATSPRASGNIPMSPTGKKIMKFGVSVLPIPSFGEINRQKKKSLEKKNGQTPSNSKEHGTDIVATASLGEGKTKQKRNLETPKKVVEPGAGNTETNELPYLESSKDAQTGVPHLLKIRPPRKPQRILLRTAKDEGKPISQSNSIAVVPTPTRTSIDGDPPQATATVFCSRGGDIMQKTLPLHKITRNFIVQKFRLAIEIDCLRDQESGREHYDTNDGSFSTLERGHAYELQLFKNRAESLLDKSSGTAFVTSAGLSEEQQKEIEFTEKDLQIGVTLSQFVYADDEGLILLGLQKQNDRGKLGITEIQLANKGTKIRYLVALSPGKLWIAFRGTDCLKRLVGDIARNAVRVCKEVKHRGLANRLLMLPLQRFIDDAQAQNKKICFVGHCVGGAIAHLFCLDLHLKQTLVNASSIAYGASYTGDSEILSLIEQHNLQGHFCTVVNQYDCIPKIINLSQEFLKFSQGAAVQAESITRTLTFAAKIFGGSGDAASREIGDYLKRLDQCVEDLLRAMPGFRPTFKPFGYYFLISFYKERWITQCTTNQLDIQKHFAEYQRTDKRSITHHNIAEYCKVLEHPNVLGNVKIDIPPGIRPIKNYTPSITDVVVDDHKSDEVRIRVEGTNLEFLNGLQPLECEAKDALGWHNAVVARDTSGSMIQKVNPTRYRYKRHKPGGIITFLVPKNPMKTRYKLETELKGCKLFVTTHFGRAKGHIWHQQSQLERQTVMLSQAEAAFVGVRKALATEHGWKFQKTKDEVHVYSRPFDDSGIECAKGVGTVKVKPSVLMDFLKDPTNRKRYDSTLNTAEKIETVNENTNVYKMSFDPKGWKSLRDYCLVMHWRSHIDSDTHTLVWRSVDHEHCPAGKNAVRGYVRFGGWSIRPNKANAEYSDVVVLINANLQGMLLSSQMNAINQKEAFLMRNIKGYFNKK